MSITARQWLILLSVQFTTILFGLTATSVTVILPQLKGTLSATQEQISWVLTFNLVATAIATPLTGWLAAKLGWRTLMVVSVAGFTAASMLCGLVDTLEALLALRVLQGAFGAPIFPMGQTIVLTSFHRSQHPFIMMMWGVGGVMGPILGPTFGGLVSDLLSWRWTFFLILPLGVAAGGLAFAALNDDEKGRARPFDYTGFVFIAIAIAATQLLFDRGQRNDWFTSPETIAECVVAGVFLVMFALHTLTAPAPLFEPAALRDRNFLIGVVVALIMGMLQYTPMVLFPPLLQELQGYPETTIGYLVASRGLGNLASFCIVAQLTRFDARLCLFIGLSIQAFAGTMMGGIRHADHVRGRDAEQHPARIRIRPQLHADGGAGLLDHADPLHDAGQRDLRPDPHAGLERVRVADPAGAGPFDGRGQRQPGELDHAFQPRPGRAVGAGLRPSRQTHVQARLAAEIQRQASMIGYINAFHLMTLVPILTAPLAWLFVIRR